MKMKLALWCTTLLLAAVCTFHSTSAQATDVSYQLNQMVSLLRSIHARTLEHRAHMERLDALMRQIQATRRGDQALQHTFLNLKNNLDSMIATLGSVESKVLQLEPYQRPMQQQQQQRPIQTYPPQTRELDTSELRILNELQTTLRRMEQNFQNYPQYPQYPTSGSHTSLSLDALRKLFQGYKIEFEENFNNKIAVVTSNQDTIQRDLRTLISIRPHTGQPTVIERDSARYVQDAVNNGFNRYSSHVEQLMDRKFRSLESTVHSVCANDYYGQSSSARTFNTRSSQHQHPIAKRKYDPSGIDIINPPTSLDHAEVGIKLKVDPNADRSYLKKKPSSCADIYKTGFRKSGIYEAYLEPYQQELPIYCDMESNGGGWTVLLRRDNTKNPVTSYDRPWSAYKNGFGDLTSEFWLGNRYIHALTAGKQVTLRFEVVDHHGQRSFAEYTGFEIGSEHQKYVLNTGTFTSGSMVDEFTSHNGSYFSTPEEDNDRHPGRNCAETFFGGWWFDNCFRVFLTGQHVFPLDSKAIQGIYWGFRFPGNERLKSAEMKIRPVKPKKYQG